MNISSILAHPRTDSFCHSIAKTAHAILESAGHNVITHDLYKEKFDPVLKAEESFTAGDSVEDVLSKVDDPIIRAHRNEIADSDGLLVVHPNWWGKPPAILAGWLDRVFVPGVAYRLESAEGEPDGLLRIRRALILNTSDTPREREESTLGDPLQLIWGNCVLPYCGVQNMDRYMLGPVAGSTLHQREEWLELVEQNVKRVFVE